jgi:hypothetical protein
MGATGPRGLVGAGGFVRRPFFFLCNRGTSDKCARSVRSGTSDCARNEWRGSAPEMMK